MQTVRHWRMQATRYRLDRLPPGMPVSDKKDISNTRENGKSTERSIQELVAQPVPVSS